MSEQPEHEEEVLEIAGLRVIAVGNREAARAVVVLLHGFAMTPRDLSPFAHSLKLPVWFLFPEGPLTTKLTPDSPETRAWWVIDPVLREQALAKGARDFAVQHPPDLPNARTRLIALLHAVDKMKPAANTPLIVGGFSQGGMLTTDTLLRAPDLPPVAAAALLSASRIAFDEWAPFLSSETRCRVRGLPMLISHGEADADLAFAAGTALKDCMIAAGANVTWVPFEQGHEIPLVVWRHLRKLVASVTVSVGT